MKDFFFRKNLFLLDLTVSIVFGAYLGRYMQLAADSGEHHPDKLIGSLLVGGFSFLLAFAVSWIASFKFSKSLGWLVLLFGGPLFFAISSRAVMFIQGERAFSTIEFLRNDLQTYLMLALLLAIPFFVILMVSRIIALVFLAYAKS
jgi:hypothetical protein